MSSPSLPQHIPVLVSPAGEPFDVATTVPLGRYTLSVNTSSGASDVTSDSDDQGEETPYHIYMLTIGNKKYAALIDGNSQCVWLKALSELRAFMQAHNMVRKYHLEAAVPEMYVNGAKNEETWQCRYMVAGKHYMGLGLTKQEAKDEAGLRMLLAYKVDIRTLM
ncbi:hypothetical protein FRC03_010134 [Tulasnella sp. 419]|nr:hypothetical protein FRC03_010134 [Tulasnella sp. 419]